MSFCSWAKGEHYRDHFERGTYTCVKCGNELFSSRSKYEHETPWPAFTETIHPKSVVKIQESRQAFKVLCGKCQYSLGHEFVGDGPKEGQSRF